MSDNLKLHSRVALIFNIY